MTHINASTGHADIAVICGALGCWEYVGEREFCPSHAGPMGLERELPFYARKAYVDALFDDLRAASDG